MSVVIRLTRTGKKRQPKYRLVVAKKRSKRDGKYIDKIGFYDPFAQPFILEVDKNKLNSWLQKGAQLSDGADKLLKNKLGKL